MFFTWIICSLTIAIAYSAGIVLSNSISHILNTQNTFKNSDKLLLGWLFWIFTASIYVLFSGNGGWGILPVSLISLFGAREFFAHLRASWKKASVFFIPISTLFAISTAGEPTNFDTGAYHMQMVQWFSLHGAVPGIANLDVHFGAFSSFFAYASSFEFPHFSGNSFRVAQFIPFVFSLLLIRESLASFKISSSPKATFLLLTLPLFLFYSRWNIASLSPDFTIGVLGFWIFSQFLNPYLTKNSSTIITTAFSIAIILSVKLSAAPFLILGIPLALAIFKNKPINFSSLKLILPFVIAIAASTWAINYILSGWLAFPSHALNLFSPDWKVPAAELTAFSEHVYKWGINPNFRAIPSFNPIEWIPEWLSRNSSIHAFPIEMALFLALPFFWIIQIRFLAKKNTPVNWIWFSVTAILGFIFWIVSSPNPRFGTLWLYASGGFAISLIVYFNFSERMLFQLKIVLVIFAGFLFLRWIPETGIRSRVFSSSFVSSFFNIPKPILGDTKPFLLADETVALIPTKGFRVFFSPLPAMRQPKNHILRRGQPISSGFKPESNIQR